MTAYSTIRRRPHVAPLAALAASALGLVLAEASTAAEPDTAPSIVVRYRDLDVASPAGAQKLYWRIVTAARLLCHWYDARELTRVVQSERCVSLAIDRAVRSVHNPQLAAVRASHMG